MNRREIVVSLFATPVIGLTAADTFAATAPRIVVHKSESCGCCKLWITHLEKAGFKVQAIDESNMGPIKERVGVPYGKGSCHTGVVDGYFIEGHVPAADIKKLLREKPDAKGLTVPGMPAGSPGMEVPSGQVDDYEVLLVAKDGSTSVYAKHGPQSK